MGPTADGDDALGHGSWFDAPNQLTPKLIEPLREVKVVSVATCQHEEDTEHSLAVTEVGRVYSWGGGSAGRLGHGDQEDQGTPKLIEALQEVRVVGVAAGYCHSLAVTEAGRVYSCGHGAFGRLGHGDEEEQHTPKLIEALQEVKVVGVAAGSVHSLASTEAGAVFGWGYGEDECLGLGLTADQLTPMRHPHLRL